MSETPEMVERVAKAIYEKRNGPGCYPWGNRTDGHKAPYLDDARAAIGAMWEPTTQMTDAAALADHDGYDNDAAGVYEEIWGAMVFAALATPAPERMR